MQQRLLGKTGFEVGEVGLGCWQFGGDFGPMTKQTATEIMMAAVENGTTLFDTADVYGNGRSEARIGHFLADTGRNIRVITKFGREADVYPDKYTEQSLRQKTEASLKRLGADHLDLTQLHCIPMHVLQDGAIFDWLRKLKDKGKIRHFGASVESVEEAMVCLEHDDLASLQIIFNIFRQKPIAALLPQAQARNVAIIVRLPLASGLLAGKFTKDTTFVETDHRNYNRDGQYFNVGETFAGLPFEKGVELADAIKAWVPEGMTMAQMAMRWILDHEAVSVVIPGASSPSQAIDNAKASDLPPLPVELHQKLAEFYQSSVHEHVRGPY
ncbi:MAG: aldo/keto reductase [Phycisphaerales bacterium]|nr:MAG: aldo/keto reductase [Phycisphaerales bacterium]